MNSRRSKKPQEVIVVGQQEANTAVKAPSTPAPIQVPISFDAWWLQVQSKHKLRPELKASIQRHFESKGFMDYKKFDSGLRDFGFRT